MFGFRQQGMVIAKELKIVGSVTAVLTDAVLPPLPEYHFLAGGDGEGLLSRIYRIGSWLSGFTQADSRFGG